MRTKLLNFLVKASIGKKKIILLTSILITIISMILANTLKIDTRWTALLPEKMPVAKEFRNIDNNFLQPANMIIAVSGSNSLELEKISSEVVDILEKNMVAKEGMSHEEIKSKEMYAKYIYGAFPEEWVKKNSLKLLKPKDSERVKNIFSNTSILNFIKQMNVDFEKEYTDSENVKNQERQIVSSLTALENLLDVIDSSSQGAIISNQTLNRVVRDQTIGNPYTFSLDNKMILVMVASSLPADDADSMVKMDKRIEQLLLPLNKKYPEYKIERTGMTAIARDEMDSVGPYTMVITFGAFLLIFLLLAWNFRSALTPVINLIPIVLGIIWAMGFISLTIGTLNLITMMMMVVLLGLGIDFTIHLTSRFYEEIGNGKSIEESLQLTIGGTGKGVITGALTTAASFLALMIADTPAIFQFGLCAGSGVLITLIASIWILPALLVMRVERKKNKSIVIKPLKNIYSIGKIATFCNKNAKLVITISIALFLIGFISSRYLEWEWNFLNLEPEGLRSVELQDEIVERYKLSVTTSMLTVDSIEESRKLRKEFKSKRVVAEVDDISQWVSRMDYDQSKKNIEQLKKNLKYSRTDFSNMTNRNDFSAELDRLWANLVEIQALAFTGGQDRIVEKTANIIGRRDSRDDGKLRIMADKFLSNNNIQWYNLEVFTNKFSNILYEYLLVMTENTDAVGIEDIPLQIKSRYISKSSDKYLMHIMPKKNLYTRQELETFQNTVNKISPSVTGTPQLILSMNLETLREGRIAVVASVFVIILLLLVDFKRPLVSFITFLPMIGSFSLIMGAMLIFREKLNYINMIAFPVIIGIGIDDGVHFMHRYLEEGHGNLIKASTSVGRAMLMTTLTTMIGFGSLMFYLMRGLASLGFVLFFGVGFCFIITITLLPALMNIFNGAFNRQ